MTQLSAENLKQLPHSIQTPDYNRADIQCGIMHMSIGGFHRAHQAVYLDDLLSLGDIQENTSWGICAVGLMPHDKDNIEKLQNQDNLYTVLERTAEQDSARVIGSILETLHAPSSTAAVLERLSHPDIKILSLTITEKGYCYDNDKNLEQNHPLIQHDLNNLDTPKTAFGFIINGLKHRKENKLKPFTVMSCDNLPSNGDLTQKLILQFAALIDQDLAAWIKANVTFPNAMVDRITPVTTDNIIKVINQKFDIQDAWPVVCEDYKQWVLEDKFCNGRPAFEKAGVQMVDDVEPYEKMKVRLLNGSHSALAYISYLLGHRAVDAAMADPLVTRFVKRYMDKDITPSVPALKGVDLTAYKEKLIERFSNPAISDQIQRLAEDGSQKIPNAILPCISHERAKGAVPQFAIFALAGWFCYLSGRDENQQPIEIKDPLADKLNALALKDPSSPQALLSLSDVFGTALPQDETFVTNLAQAMQAIQSKGIKQALNDILSN